MARACVINVSAGGWYPRGLARLTQSVARVGGPEVVGWSNSYPEGSPTHQAAMYSFKTFAFREAQRMGYELVLWLDSSCYAIAPLGQIFEHIDREGHYLMANGWTLGQWSSDTALRNMGIGREEAFSIPECSTMAVGLDLRTSECQKFLDAWHALSIDGETFPGFHTNIYGLDEATRQGVAYRDVGPVSKDPRCMGHRHDQTAATGIAHKMGLALTPRPVFVDYYNEEPDERTLVLSKGL